MGRRQGRATRFRPGDAAALVAAIPPDALHRHCFGVSACGGLVQDVLGGIDALRLLAASPGVPAVPLSSATEDADFRVPDVLEGEALLAALDILARAEFLAAADGLAAADAVDEHEVGAPRQSVERAVSQRSLADLLRVHLGLPGWWSLPHARITVVNQPDAGSWRVRIACPCCDRLAEMAREAVQAFHDALDGEGLLEAMAGTMPGGLTTYALPPHGILTRIEFARVRGAYWLRSAAALLALHASRAHLALHGGLDHPEPGSPWIWTGAFASPSGAGAGLARLGTWGRPPVSHLEIEGPFVPGRAVAVTFKSRPAGADAADAFFSAVAESGT